MARVEIARNKGGIPVWSILQFGGGVMMSVFVVMPSLMWGTAAFDVGRPAETTKLMNDFANLLLVTTDQYYIFQMIPITVLCLSKPNDPTSPFPRWLGYFNLWVALMFEAGVAGFVPKTGPFALDGLFPFWIPLVLVSVWIIVLDGVILRALKAQSGAHSTSS
jgi:hypothetical protein